MKSSLIVLSFIFTLAVSGCSEKKHYYWTEVPYCNVPSGQWGSHFEQSIRVLTKASDGGGISSLHGMRPLRSVEFADEILVAVVACGSDKHFVNDLDKFLEDFSDSKVPIVCPNQRILVHPISVTKRPSNKKGFAGSLPFPKVDPKELTCKRGILAFGDGA